MQKIKWFVRILLSGSLIFVIYYLINFNYVVFNKINFNFYLLFSLLLLWAGFYVSTVSWKKSLQAHKIIITQNLATYSHGISVFAKYIPGKMWVVLGRAGIVSEKTKKDILLTSSISLKEQLSYLFIGMILSLPVVFFIEQPFIVIIILITSIGLALFLFVKPIHNFSILLLNKIFKKKTEIPFLNLKEFWIYGKIIILYWLLWSTGFYLLSRSILSDINFSILFIFPISVCYGLLAVFIPGGIGVREGIIVLFLKSSGIETETAITLSLIQRLWFISGEIFIFALASFIQFNEKNKHRNTGI